MHGRPAPGLSLTDTWAPTVSLRRGPGLRKDSRRPRQQPWSVQTCVARKHASGRSASPQTSVTRPQLDGVCQVELLRMARRGRACAATRSAATCTSSWARTRARARHSCAATAAPARPARTCTSRRACCACCARPARWPPRPRPPPRFPRACSALTRALPAGLASALPAGSAWLLTGCCLAPALPSGPPAPCPVAEPALGRDVNRPGACSRPHGPVGAARRSPPQAVQPPCPRLREGRRARAAARAA